jgi:hypothetical protein
MSTVAQSFSDVLVATASHALNSFVLPTLSFALKANRGFDVSVEELAKYLNVSPSVSMPAVANMSVGLNAPPSTAPPAASGRKKATAKVVEKPAPGTGCKYQFARTTAKGEKGTVCDSVLFMGNYCKSHCYLKNGGGFEKPAKAEKAAPGLTTGLPGAVANGLPQLTPFPTLPQIEESKAINMGVKLHTVPDFLIEDTYGFILDQQVNDAAGNPTVIGRFVNNTYTPVTAEYLSIVQKWNLTVQADPAALAGSVARFGGAPAEVAVSGSAVAMPQAGLPVVGIAGLPAFQVASVPVPAVAAVPAGFPTLPVLNNFMPQTNFQTPMMAMAATAPVPVL